MFPKEVPSYILPESTKHVILGGVALPHFDADRLNTNLVAGYASFKVIPLPESRSYSKYVSFSDVIIQQAT